ncbi:recombinase family protein [Streptomyces sp. 184]|uniref:recombinase family protein n=1 Tax=Streptomyces sp. 184 TaxID=1827526 RepID=UPI0038914461
MSAQPVGPDQRATTQDTRDAGVLQAPRTSDTETATVTAYLYDRTATRAAGPLDERLARCRAFAEARGWLVAGAWVDRGDDALTVDHRPAWDALVAAMRQDAAARVVCLVEEWDRIARPWSASASLRNRVRRAGGVTCTTRGECDQDERRGRLTVPPWLETPAPHSV